MDFIRFLQRVLVIDSYPFVCLCPKQVRMPIVGRSGPLFSCSSSGSSDGEEGSPGLQPGEIKFPSNLQNHYYVRDSSCEASTTVRRKRWKVYQSSTILIEVQRSCNRASPCVTKPANGDHSRRGRASAFSFPYYKQAACTIAQQRNPHL